MYQIQSETLAGLAKILEETSELNVNLAKIIATGGKPEYWGGVDLHKEIQDELADVFAAISFFIAVNEFVDMTALENRVKEKLSLYETWREQHDG